MSHDGRPRLGLWLADHALALGGLALVALGLAGSPLALSLGWAALGIAFFAFVAQADGLAVPRPGRAAIRTCGCWEIPLAFTVRHGGRVLLFTRDEDVDRGGWSDVYTVASDRPAPASIRGGSSPSVPATDGRCGASPRSGLSASSATSG